MVLYSIKRPSAMQCHTSEKFCFGREHTLIKKPFPNLKFHPYSQALISKAKFEELQHSWQMTSTHVEGSWTAVECCITNICQESWSSRSWEGPWCECRRTRIWYPAHTKPARCMEWHTPVTQWQMGLWGSLTSQFSQMNEFWAEGQEVEGDWGRQLMVISGFHI